MLILHWFCVQLRPWMVFFRHQPQRDGGCAGGDQAPCTKCSCKKSQIGNVGTRGEFQDSACFAPVLTIGTILTILSSGFKWPSCETSGWVCRTQIFVMLGRKLVIHRCLFLDAITGGLLARPDARLLLEKEWKRHEYLTSNSCLTDTFPSERVLQYQTSAELDISYVQLMHIPHVEYQEKTQLRKSWEPSIESLSCFGNVLTLLSLSSSTVLEQ